MFNINCVLKNEPKPFDQLIGNLPPNIIFPHLWPIEEEHQKAKTSSRTDENDISDDSYHKLTATSMAENNNCAVCGDRSSGKHYGQFTCEGCKSFFKRSVRKNLSYSCKKKKTCVITMNNRNHCQFCRFQKCLFFGMKKEAVQQGRNDIVFSSNFDFSQSTLPKLNKSTTERDPLNLDEIKNMYSTILNMILRAEPTLSRISSKMNNFLKNRYAWFSKLNISPECPLKILFNVVNWTRNMPFFPELKLKDQVRLLQHNWMRLFFISLVTANTEGRLNHFLNQMKHSTAIAAESLSHQEIFWRTFNQIESMRLSTVDLGLLKAINLFNPTTPDIEGAEEVDNVRLNLIKAWEMKRLSMDESEEISISSIILKASCIDDLSAEMVEMIFFRVDLGNVEIIEMLKDILLYGPPPNQISANDSCGLYEMRQIPKSRKPSSSLDNDQLPMKKIKM